MDATGKQGNKRARQTAVQLEYAMYYGNCWDGRQRVALVLVLLLVLLVAMRMWRNYLSVPAVTLVDGFLRRPRKAL